MVCGNCVTALLTYSHRKSHLNPGLNLRYRTLYSELWFLWVCQPVQSNARMTLKLDEDHLLRHVQLSMSSCAVRADVAHYVCVVVCVYWGWDLSRFVLILLHELFVMELLTNLTDSSWKRNLVSFKCLHCLCEGVIISVNNIETREVTEWTDEMFKARAFATLSALWHNTRPDSEVYPSCQGIQFGRSRCRFEESNKMHRRETDVNE